MRVNLVSLFPEFFDSPLASGLMAKAVASGLLSVARINPRDHAEGAYKSVDDTPYGGGPGMVMRADVLARALAQAGFTPGTARSGARPGRLIYLSPAGRPFDQAMARELAAEVAQGTPLTLLCGRYEGIDARLLEAFPIEPVSVGDYVLNGGETGALCILEAVARLLPGFMGTESSADEESFSRGLLEYPHYTRPEIFEGLAVPEVLTGGDHARISAHRREAALETTLAKRPDLLETAELTSADMAHLRRLNTRRTKLSRAIYLALVHYPVVNRKKKTVAVSLTNLDIHDIARVSRSYGLGGFFVVQPLEDQQRLAARLLTHWREGEGAAANPDRAEALTTVDVVARLDDARQHIAERTGQTVLTLATSARDEAWRPTEAGTNVKALRPEEHAPWTLTRVREAAGEQPVLLVLGTGSGLAPEVLAQADGIVRPLRSLTDYNHLSVRSAAAILTDRLLGDLG